MPRPLMTPEQIAAMEVRAAAFQARWATDIAATEAARKRPAARRLSDLQEDLQNCDSPVGQRIIGKVIGRVMEEMRSQA